LADYRAYLHIFFFDYLYACLLFYVLKKLFFCFKNGFEAYEFIVIGFCLGGENVGISYGYLNPRDYT
jgi:hypothetical protein